MAREARRRRWWRPTLWLAMVMAVPFVVWPLSIGRQLIYAGDYVHLALMQPAYTLQVNGSGPACFDWGSFGLATSGFTRVLVLRPGRDIPCVGGDAGTMEEPAAAFQVRHLFGAYYVIEDYR